jgi:hypothetical protein
MCYARDNVRACKALRRSTIGHHRRPWACPLPPSPRYQLSTTELHIILLVTIAYLNNELVAMLSDTIDYHGMLWCPMVSCVMLLCPMVSCALSYRIHRYRDERMQTIQLDTINPPSQTTDSAW